MCLFPLSAPSHAAASRVRPLMADVAADALRLAASVNALGSAAANAVFICPAAAPEEEAMREGARETGAGEAPRLRRRVRCASRRRAEGRARASSSPTTGAICRRKRAGRSECKRPRLRSVKAERGAASFSGSCASASRKENFEFAGGRFSEHSSRSLARREQRLQLWDRPLYYYR